MINDKRMLWKWEAPCSHSSVQSILNLAKCLGKLIIVNRVVVGTGGNRESGGILKGKVLAISLSLRSPELQAGFSSEMPLHTAIRAPIRVCCTYDMWPALHFLFLSPLLSLGVFPAISSQRVTFRFFVARHLRFFAVVCVPIGLFINSPLMAGKTLS